MIRSKLKSEKGAVSVLVVFMMIVFVVFGVLALTASRANLALGNKSRDWQAGYYMMDAKGEELLTRVDDCLEKAELAAREWISTGSTAQFHENAVASINSLSGDTASRFYRAYYLDAEKELLQLAEDREDLEVDSLDEDEVVAGAPMPQNSPWLVVSISYMQMVEKVEQHLDITIAVDPMRYEFGAGAPRRASDMVKRFSVIGWKEWQPKLDLNDVEEPVFDGSQFNPTTP